MSGTAALRALVVDDEPAARRLLTELLSKVPDVDVVATCRHGREALAWLQEHRADLLFLDVEMPGLGGFEIVEGLPRETPDQPRPAVIFVTAHDQFAVQAFEAEAWDYLLKPFDSERLDQALDRARRRLGRTAAPPAPSHDEFSPAHKPLDRLAVPQGRGRVTIRMADVLWIQAESNYVRFHLQEASYLSRTSLTALERRLDPGSFVRIHRSAIVNVEWVERLTPRGHGDLALTLRDGREVLLSRRYREAFEQVLESLP